MSADSILPRLEMVRPSGAGRWMARCPAHEDRGPSLSIRELDDGRTLIHCFAGCQPNDVLAALGLSLSDLFPDGGRLPGRGPFPAADVLRAVLFEALVVVASGAKLRASEPLLPEEWERLMLAVERLQEASRLAGARHG
jgi:hypothetical protein